ncbi:hypothetical protein V6N13_139383 [Hibiscus sabdariffa]|uniref:Uncharacterized protein n=1 Tax=Hibiscus sabdariffa TaxID=183260 RepID=A0ABR2C8A9_9ROSI
MESKHKKNMWKKIVSSLKSLTIVNHRYRKSLKLKTILVVNDVIYVKHSVDNIIDRYNDDNDNVKEKISEIGDSDDCIPSSNEIDTKAEEFINRLKQAWRLEKQKSDEEYFAMLARGA